MHSPLQTGAATCRPRDCSSHKKSADSNAPGPDGNPPDAETCGGSGQMPLRLAARDSPDDAIKSHSVRVPPVSMLLHWAGGSGVTSTLGKLLDSDVDENSVG